jgi:hypothetical protein
MSRNKGFHIRDKQGIKRECTINKGRRNGNTGHHVRKNGRNGKDKTCAQCKKTVSKIDLCIPRNETARPCSQLPHSCTSVSDLYTPRKIGRPILEVYKSLTNTVHECRNWERGRAASFLGIHKSQCRSKLLKGTGNHIM